PRFLGDLDAKRVFLPLLDQRALADGIPQGGLEAVHERRADGLAQVAIVADRVQLPLEEILRRMRIALGQIAGPADRVIDDLRDLLFLNLPAALFKLQKIALILRRGRRRGWCVLGEFSDSRLDHLYLIAVLRDSRDLASCLTFFYQLFLVE